MASPSEVTPVRSTSAEGPSIARGDGRLARAWEAVSRPGVAVLSTDVFDTLLWRQARQPVDAFPMVADRLRERGSLDPELSSAAFGQLRAAAETRARNELARASGAVEVRLEEVYALIPDWIFAGASPVSAMKVELELERDILVPDLDVLALLLAAVEAGKRVVAVSDIYFTEAQLRFLLRQPAVEALRFTRVFTSCDHRRNKSGGLFDVVLAELGVAPEQVFHLGDNEEADVEYPSRLGIDTLHFPRQPAGLEAIMRTEQRGLQTAGERLPRRTPRSDEVAAELTALRGKVAARGEGLELPQALQPFWSFGATIYGPVFTGFATWAAGLAAGLGASRVHCFMREGGFLGDLVGRAADSLGHPLQTSPLWLNRAVLSRAVIADASPEELAGLLVRRRRPTVGGFLHTLGLNHSDLPRFASHADTSLEDVTTRATLLDALAGDDAIRGRILEHAAAARARVVSYVDGLLEGDRRLVTLDLGWAGSAQGLLRRVLVQAGRTDLEITGLYLMNHRGATDRVLDGMRLHGFLGELGAPEEAISLAVRSPEVLEQVCMPEHGSQADLDGRGEPVLEDAVSNPLQAVEAAAVRQGIVTFQREWLRYESALPGKLGALAEARDVLRAILVRSVVSPTEREATQFGGWQHDENQGSDRSELIADPATAARLRHLDPAGLRELPMEQLYWPYALARRVDATWAESIAAAACGEISWEALSGEIDTGAFRIGASRGVDFDPGDVVEVTPRRNRFGLSHVQGTLRAAALQEIELRPAEHPCVLRVDYLELRCQVQGAAEAQVIRLDAAADFAALQRINCFALNPNVFVVHGSDPRLRLDLTAHLPQTVFRVDVSCGFSTVAIGQLLPTPGRVRNPEEAGVAVERLEALLADLTGSASWKLTKPLRVAKRVLGS